MPSELLSALADRLDPPPNPYTSDPAAWVVDRLGEFLWSKQREVGRSVVEHRRTAVPSCHETGKSFNASRLASWWIDIHPPGTATVVTTAPTFMQVRGILWKEIKRAHRKGSLAGHCNQTEWWIGEHLAAFGRKPSDYDENAFQGIHDEWVLVILDEACGIPEQLWVAANSLIADVNGRILAIGNPDDPTSYFAKICQPGSGWNVIEIGYRDTPNFTGEAVPEDVARRLISQLYLDDMALDVGVGSPLWISKVEGRFPIDATDGVIPASAVARCRIPAEPSVPPQPSLVQVQLGVDVGGSEQGDKTVVRERRDRKAGRVWRMQSSESERVAEFIRACIVESGAQTVKIDSIGIGWGVAGHLNAMREDGKHAARVVKVNVGAAPMNPKRFPKLRDELWWDVGRGLSERQDWDLSAIDDRTAADLIAPKWKPDPAGRIKVEPKQDTQSRLGRSPDDADALLLAFYAGGSNPSDFFRQLVDEQAPKTADDTPDPAVLPELRVGAYLEQLAR